MFSITAASRFTDIELYLLFSRVCNLGDQLKTAAYKTECL
jgi:hypothetical protein